MPKNRIHLISSKELLRTPIFWVTEDVAKDPEGFEIKRAIVQHAGSAVMMAIDEKGRILLVRQYRLPARDYLWELPAGRVDEGEKPLAAAKRELKEETGFQAKRWTKLVSFFASPGYVAERMTLFVARDLTAGDAEPMEDERIQIGWFKLKEADEMIREGRIQDAKTIIGVSLWRRVRKTLD
jgi:ADP-ribose pyrophosphatase